MLNGIILGLIAMFSFGIIEIALKKVSERLGTHTTILYRGLFVVITLLLFSILFQQPVILSPEVILWMILTSFFGIIAFFSFVYALKIGKVSVISPVAHGSAAVTVLLAVLFYKEVLSTFQAFGIILVILGTLFVSFKWKELKNLNLQEITKGLPYALLTLFTWGITFFLYKISVNKAGAFTPALLIDGMTFLGMLAAVPFVKKVAHPSKKDWWLLAFIGLFSGIAILCLSYGFTKEFISVVTPIVYASPFVTVILARIFLKETLEINQYLGIMGIIVGVVLLAF